MDNGNQRRNELKKLPIAEVGGSCIVNIQFVLLAIFSLHISRLIDYDVV